MKWLRTIPVRLASNVLFISLALICLFHLTVLFEFIPYQVVRGGKIKSRTELMPLELISLGMNIFILWILAQKAFWIRAVLSSKTIKVAMWCITALFALNTLGNLYSENKFEKVVFSPVTFLLMILCLRLVIEEEPQFNKDNSNIKPL